MNATIQTPGAAPGNGAPAPVPTTRSHDATASKYGAIAAETPPAATALIFDFDGPINAAHAATLALQNLTDEPIDEHSQRAVVELVASILGDINRLKMQFEEVHEALHPPSAVNRAPEDRSKPSPDPDPEPPRRGDAKTPDDRLTGITEILKLCDEMEATKAEAQYLWHRGAGHVWAARPGDNDRRLACYKEYFERLGELLSYRPDYVDEAMAMFAVAIDIVKEREMEPDSFFAQAPALDLLVAAYGALNDAAVADRMKRRQEWAEEDAGRQAAE